MLINSLSARLWGSSTQSFSFYDPFHPSLDTALHQNATEQLETASRDNYVSLSPCDCRNAGFICLFSLVLTLSRELANKQAQLHVRDAANAALKDVLKSRVSLSSRSHAKAHFLFFFIINSRL